VEDQDRIADHTPGIAHRSAEGPVVQAQLREGLAAREAEVAERAGGFGGGGGFGVERESGDPEEQEERERKAEFHGSPRGEKPVVVPSLLLLVWRLSCRRGGSPPRPLRPGGDFAPTQAGLRPAPTRSNQQPRTMAS